jgi:subtilisin-like proprotein convertase family protein
MPDNFTGDFLLTVQNATNNTLGQNGQGVCGVTLSFDHEYVGDLSIVLTSPAGQSVTLVGPIGLWGPTDGTSWNIAFVPCGDPVTPDPGFTPNWNNNQPWGLFGAYSGSYYPANGCLQNFNMGPVNGTWTLTVTDGQSNDVGNFYDYSIIFCDPSGILCFTCAAEAGNLTQPDVQACEGSPNLNLNLPPSFTANEVPPPPTEYTYTYLIAGPGGIIQAIEDVPNLSAYQPGTYTVCGMSYYTLQADQVPTPNGSLTIQQLTNQLNSASPPFCGDITTNCVNVTVFPDVPDEEESATICAPECYQFLGQTYCQSGTYTVNRVSANGCPYTSTLFLTVRQPSFTTVNELACETGCTQTPGFAGICDPGQYQATFTNYLGCDSTVTLNFNYLPVNAVIAPPPPFPCAGGTIQLSGAGSTAGLGTTYLWTASNGGNIVGPAGGLNVLVDAPGSYQLLVCRSAAGVFCCDSTGVTINGNQNVPQTPTVISGPLPACEDSLTLYTVSPTPGADSYLWTVSDSVIIVSGQGTDSLRVLWPIRDSSLICVQAVNTCGTSPTFCLPAYAIGVPGPAALSGAAIVCPQDTALYVVQSPGDSTVTGYLWIVDSLGTLLSGQGNDSALIVWNQAGVSQLCYRAQNICGNGPQQCREIRIEGTPQTPVINGPDTACQGSTAVFTTAAPGAALSYNWQIQQGMIIGGNAADTIIVQWDTNADTGFVCLQLEGACGTSPAGCKTVQLAPPPPIPAISGETLRCPGSTGAYMATAVGGATDYIWTVPAGAVILSGQNSLNLSVNWLAAPGGNICVAAVSGCGTGPQACLPVEVPEIPVANAGADTSFCGTTGTLAALPSVPGTTGFWSQSDGPGTALIANPSSAGSAVSVSQPGTYAFAWTETNKTCSATDTVRLEFFSTPTLANTIPVCDGANTSYTLEITVTGGTAPFIVNGALLGANPFVSDPIPSGQSYSFTVLDANGCAGNSLAGSFDCNCTTYSGTVAVTPATACLGDTLSAGFNNDANLDSDDVTGFFLHTGSGAALGTIFARNNTGNFTFQAGMSFGVTYYISPAAGNSLNGAPDPSDPCFSIAAGRPVVFYDFPLAEAGTYPGVCGNMLTLNGNPGAGLWTVLSTPPAGVLTLANTQNPASGVQANLPGDYQIVWTRLANGCASSDTVTLRFFEVPVVTGVQEICNSTGTAYTLQLAFTGGAAPYLVNGQSVAGSPFISAPINSGAAYLFQIADANGCTTANVSGVFTCDCLTDAGTMSANPIQACVGASVTATANADLQLDGNDVGSFVLHSGNGASLGQIFDQNSSGVFGWVPGMTPGTTYYISRVAGNNTGGVPDLNDPCLSVAPGQPVVFLPVPTPNAGPDAAFCGMQGQLNAAPGPNAGQWSAISGPGQATIAAPTNPTGAVMVTAAGTYRFTWTQANAACSATDTVTLRFNTLPDLSGLQEICDSVNTAYRVVVQILNGAAPFTVSGITGVFTNNSFVSAPIPSGSNYAFTITDANGCSATPVNGQRNCDCATDAGSMSGTLRLYCAGDPATGGWNNDATTDANDLVQFVLHTQPGATLGAVLATSNTPNFAFGPNLQTGVTYYISAIAGNNVNGSVSTSDPCFSVAPGTPVRWKALPTAALSGSATICAGDTAVLTLSGTGAYPLNVSWSAPGGTVQNLPIPGPAPVQLPVNPGVTGVYQLIQVLDGSLPTCTNTAGDAAVITVNQPVQAGQPLATPALCADSIVLFSLRDLLAGEDGGGVWTDISIVPATGGAFNPNSGAFLTSGQQAGLYRFRYALDAAAPCPDTAAVVSVLIHPNPVADAGPDRTISCDNPEAQLGGPGAPGVSYSWQINNIALPNSTAAQIEVSTEGLYTQIAQNTFGCSDRDDVLVTTTATTLSATPETEHISCFGRRDGRIILNALTGGTPPLRFSLNGGPFGASAIFDNLGPGWYQITVQDAQGCEWISDSLALSEPPLLTADAGPDLNLRLGEAANIRLTVSVPVVDLDTIIWTPLPDSSAVNATEIQFTPLKSQTFKVTVLDSRGCRAEDELYIQVDRRKNIYVPNIFNPDLGGLTVYGGADVLTIEQFSIYDRWGSALFERSGFEPNNPADGWQGAFRGKPVTPGVYAWYAVVKFLDGATEIFSGDVTIFR